MSINVSRRTFLKSIAGGAAVLAVAGTTGYLMAKPKPATGPLPGNKIAKLQFVDPLPDLHVITKTDFELSMEEFTYKVIRPDSCRQTNCHIPVLMCGGIESLFKQQPPPTSVQ